MSRPGAGQVGAGDGKIAAFRGPAAVAAGASTPLERPIMSLYQASVPVFVRGLNAGRAAGKSRVACPRSRYRSRRTRQPGWRRTCILCLARSSAPATRQVRRAASVADRGAEVSRRGNHAGAAAPARGRHHRLSAGLAPRRRRKPQGHAVVRRLQARVPGRRLSAELRAAELLLPRRHRLRHPAQPGREDRQAGFLGRIRA